MNHQNQTKSHSKSNVLLTNQFRVATNCYCRLFHLDISRLVFIIGITRERTKIRDNNINVILLVIADLPNILTIEFRKTVWSLFVYFRPELVYKK